MPHSSHIHKSMLLRGLKMPAPVLEKADKDEIAAKSRSSGRGFGGVPFRNGGERGGRINYAQDKIQQHLPSNFNVPQHIADRFPPPSGGQSHGYGPPPSRGNHYGGGSPPFPGQHQSGGPPMPPYPHSQGRQQGYQAVSRFNAQGPPPPPPQQNYGWANDHYGQNPGGNHYGRR